MSKKIIRNVAAISLGTLILCGLLFVVSGANTTTTGAGETTGFLGSVSFFLAILCLIVSLIAGLIGYIGALVKTAQLRAMKWFVGILLFGITAALIFGIFGPEKKTTDQPLDAFLYGSYKQTKRTMGFK
jgi:hypothetical protein